MVYYDGREKKSREDWSSGEPPLVLFPSLFFQLCVFREILCPSIRTESLEQAYKYLTGRATIICTCALRSYGIDDWILPRSSRLTIQAHFL